MKAVIGVSIVEMPQHIQGYRPLTGAFTWFAIQASSHMTEELALVNVEESSCKF